MKLQATQLRIARPTTRLDQVTRMYIDGLGFQLLGEFEDHQGFDGKMIGHPGHCYHLEFTRRRGSVVPPPDAENLLAFYLPNSNQWKRACDGLIAAGFQQVPSVNPYWDRTGRTFRDCDDCRVVLVDGAGPI